MKSGRFRHFLLSYFTYTRGEKNAALLLAAALLLLQFGLWYRHHYLTPAPYILDNRERAAITKMERKGEASLKKYDEHNRRGPALASFDPNITDSAGFVERGLSPKQAASFIRYRDKTGGFRSAEEVQKVRVLRPELFRQWLPYMIFSELKDAAPSRQASKKARSLSVQEGKLKQQTLFVIDLNRADTTALMDLPLIGPGRARAMVNYRERLGGYHRLDQLLELKVIPDSVFERIQARLNIGKGVYRKIDLNHLQADSLRHPYLPKALARMLVAYREQHGNYRSLEDLEHLPLANDEILRKLAPYLTINP
ncbi:MAG: helix-hairpin-helix domain-containing protein [Bacteroidia bacterium]|nr:helix-hairpin-helix domain-containing protein [Bacteroidia bacterium]